MQLLILEYITGGALSGSPLPESLQREGMLMLDEMLRLANQVEGVKPIITLDARIRHKPQAAHIVTIRQASEYIPAIQSLASDCDAGWVIAPETDAALQQGVEILVDLGLPLINCSRQAIELTGDKLKCTQHLQLQGIPVVPLIDQAEAICDLPERVVVKPRFGVGCEGVQLFSGNARERLTAYLNQPNEWLVQPYIEGTPSSLSLFCWAGHVQVLSHNCQDLNIQQGRFTLRGCITNDVPINIQAESLAQKLVKSISGLSGYVGVDIIESGEIMYVVEINPRLTTSMVGLHEATGLNVVQMGLESLAADRLIRSDPWKHQAVKVKIQ